MKILVTGNARFIGFHTSGCPQERVDAAVEIGAVNACYDPSIEKARLGSVEESAANLGGWPREYYAK